MTDFERKRLDLVTQLQAEARRLLFQKSLQEPPNDKIGFASLRRFTGNYISDDFITTHELYIVTHAQRFNVQNKVMHAGFDDTVLVPFNDIRSRLDSHINDEAKSVMRVMEGQTGTVNYRVRIRSVFSPVVRNLGLQVQFKTADGTLQRIAIDEEFHVVPSPLLLPTAGGIGGLGGDLVRLAFPHLFSGNLGISPFFEIVGSSIVGVMAVLLFGLVPKKGWNWVQWLRPNRVDKAVVLGFLASMFVEATIVRLQRLWEAIIRVL